MKALIKYFFNGLLIIIPMAVSIYAVFWAFKAIDGLLGLDGYPGAGLLITLAMVTAIGFLANNFFTKKLFDYFELIVSRVPLVKLLYSSIKDLIGAFVGEKKSFNKPVLATFAPGVRAMGFITRESLEQLGLVDQVAVYFPQSYNFAGNLLIMPRSQVEPLTIDSSEAMTFIVSGGVAGSGKEQAGSKE